MAESRAVVLSDEVIQRIRQDSAVAYVARELGYSRWALLRIARGSNIPLRRGALRVRGAAAYARKFDRWHGPGFADRFLARGREVSLTTLGTEFGFSRQWASEVWRRLTSEKKPLVKPAANPRWKELTSELIRAAMGNSESIQEVCQKLGVSGSALYDRLRLFHLELPPHVRKPKLKRPDITWERVEEMVRSSRSLANAAKKLGTSVAMLHRRASQAGQALPRIFRRPRHRPDITREKLREARRQEKTAVSIARLLGVDIELIMRRAKRYAIVLPTRKSKQAKLRSLGRSVRSLRARGCIFSEIAGILGASTSSVHRWYHRNEERK